MNIIIYEPELQNTKGKEGAEGLPAILAQINLSIRKPLGD